MKQQKEGLTVEEGNLYTEEQVMELLKESLIYHNEKFGVKKVLARSDFLVIGAVSLAFQYHKEKSNNQTQNQIKDNGK